MVKKRLSLLCEYLNIKNYSKLAEYLEVSRTQIYSWIKHQSIANEELILAKNPEINIDWLRTGEGPMLLQKEPPTPPPNKIAARIEPGNDNGKAKVNEQIQQRKKVVAAWDQPTADPGDDEEKKEFRRVMASLCQLVSQWQGDEYGEDSLTAQRFSMELHSRFPELGDWLKKRKGEIVADGSLGTKSANSGK